MWNKGHHRAAEMPEDFSLIEISTRNILANQEQSAFEKIHCFHKVYFQMGFSFNSLSLTSAQLHNFYWFLWSGYMLLSSLETSMHNRCWAGP